MLIYKIPWYILQRFSCDWLKNCSCGSSSAERCVCLLGGDWGTLLPSWLSLMSGKAVLSTASESRTGTGGRNFLGGWSSLLNALYIATVIRLDGSPRFFKLFIVLKKAPFPFLLSWWCETVSRRVPRVGATIRRALGELWAAAPPASPCPPPPPCSPTGGASQFRGKCLWALMGFGCWNPWGHF